LKEKEITVSFSLKTVLWVLGTVLALWLFFILREVLVVLLISFIFAAALDPTVDKLEHKKIPRIIAIAGIYVLVLLFLSMIIKSVIPPAISQVTTFGQNKEIYIDKITSYFPGVGPDVKAGLADSIVNFINSLTQAKNLPLLSQAAGVFSGFIGLILVLVISFYLLIEKDGTEKWIASYVPSQYQTKSLAVAKKITAKMSSWFRGQMLLCVIVFLADFIALTILKVPFALTLGLLAGFLELLPIAGPIIAGALAGFVALTISPLLTLIVVVYFFLVQQIENHVLVPQIMKKTLGLHPVAIIFALLAGSKLLGILGIIIAVPVAAAISVLFNEFYQIKAGVK
jgi:predicted PurR-regulated permease PerM